jgi:transcriptional regulator with XRE-family HTH domain
MAVANPDAGQLLRTWRQRRKLSQLDLSLTAAISSRHLSFVETGRARPSREMLLHLADRLELPLRDRNELLLAGGFAPVYAERPLDSADMSSVRDALDRFLRAHEPYPAVVIDRHYGIVGMNGAVAALTEGVSAELLGERPPNALRVTLHPDGMAPRIANLAEWSGHLLHRLKRQAANTGDPVLRELYDELAAYPGVELELEPGSGDEIILPLRLRNGLSFFGTVSTFGAANDVTLEELSIEAFYPADAATAERLLAGR